MYVDVCLRDTQSITIPKRGPQLLTCPRQIQGHTGYETWLQSTSNTRPSNAPRLNKTGYMTSPNGNGAIKERVSSESVTTSLTKDLNPVNRDYSSKLPVPFPLPTTRTSTPTYLILSAFADWTASFTAPWSTSLAISGRCQHDLLRWVISSTVRYFVCKRTYTP